MIIYAHALTRLLLTALNKDQSILVEAQYLLAQSWSDEGNQQETLTALEKLLVMPGLDVDKQKIAREMRDRLHLRSGL